MQNRKAMTLVELIVVIIALCFVLFLIVFVVPLFSGGAVDLKDRLICATNLKGMGNALNVYAFDYRDEYPIAGGGGVNSWAVTTDGWDNPYYQWDGDDKVTVSASLYMLVREADVGVKSFICQYSDQQAFVNDTPHDVVELWDFGPDPTEHQSYSYQYPYGKFPADGTKHPGNAIMADRNPWFDEKLKKSSIKKETAETFKDKVSLIDFLLKTDKWKQQIGNSEPHDREGQNVLFNDGHVDFVKRPDVGTRYDNIYTIGGPGQEEKRRGIAPTFEEIDAVDEFDSLLVNDRSQ
ncbi:MAG: type II secretion system protein [Planctomycetes bacterium]|nr:type II secretion system protein [Planctomycetota bacterium]